MYKTPLLPKYKSDLRCLLVIKSDPLLVSLIGLHLGKGIKIPHAPQEPALNNKADGKYNLPRVLGILLKFNFS